MANRKEKQEETIKPTVDLGCSAVRSCCIYDPSCAGAYQQGPGGTITLKHCGCY
ncbi:hypothetical protein [Bacillus gobiensis]|uniref:hypothetical protein n=1 Tax=Bacillus gobiensis TaxID=1441095 RepID=UPI003D1D0D72